MVEPIKIAGQCFSALKTFWQGTHRTTSPEVTFAKIQPYFSSIGLTRLSNITHLDRIGIPVTQAIRPNSYSLASTSGKGLTLELALVSAAMEALEFHCAETAAIPHFELPYSRLIECYPHIALEDLPLSGYSVFHIDRPEQWCLGWDLIQKEEVAVPLHSVLFDYRLQSGNWSNLLSFETISTNGLASGNQLLEAVTSGLFELVERDAVACCTDAQLRVGYQKPRVKLETIDSPVVRGLLEQFYNADLVPFLFDCTLDTDIPVYEALCFDSRDESTWTCHGCGAHLDPEVAMTRALTEAAQTRAIAISGSRDDCFESYYITFCLRDSNREIARLESYPATIDARTRRSEATSSFEGDIDVILAKLQRIGCQQAIVVNLTPPEWDISVVRVIVPGLEGFRSHAYDYRPKHRATAFTQTKQAYSS
jgi:ribosomal protein S12 methylthiotransferase accessory factor